MRPNTSRKPGPAGYTGRTRIVVNGFQWVADPIGRVKHIERILTKAGEWERKRGGAILQPILEGLEGKERLPTRP